MNAAALADLTRRLLVRAVSGDFQKNHASDDERQQMAQAPQPVADPLAQDYVAWRRAVLWVGGVLLGAGALIGLAEHQKLAEKGAHEQLAAQGQAAIGVDLQNAVEQLTRQVGANNLAIMDGLMDFLLFMKVLVAVLALTAAWKWLHVRRSRALTRWALIAALVIPLLVSAWPWGQFLDFDHLQRDFGAGAEAVKKAKDMVALLIASSLVSTIAPKLIALFPGIIRSAMTLKTLLPEAATPGWLVVVFGPFLVVPALRRFTNASMHGVVATSLMVIALVGSGAVVTALMQGARLPMPTTLFFVLATAVGMGIGRLISPRLSERTIQRGFALVLLTTSASLIVRSLAVG